MKNTEKFYLKNWQQIIALVIIVYFFSFVGKEMLDIIVKNGNNYARTIWVILIVFFGYLIGHSSNPVQDNE